MPSPLRPTANADTLCAPRSTDRTLCPQRPTEHVSPWSTLRTGLPQKPTARLLGDRVPGGLRKSVTRGPQGVSGARCTPVRPQQADQVHASARNE